MQNHIAKDCLDMKINHGQALLTMVQHRIVTNVVLIWKSTMVNYVYFRVYNINPLGLILLPWVYNPWNFCINPFGLVFPNVYNINMMGLLI